MKRIFILISFFCLAGVANTLFAQEVKINTNLAIEADGTVRMDGAATVWDDIMVFPDATSKGSTNPPTMTTAFKKNGGSQGVFIWMFSHSTEQELYFTVQVPHGYKVGSTLYPHVHWTTTVGTPDGSNVVWGLEYTVIAIGGSFPNTTIVTGSSVIAGIGTPTGTGQHLINSLGIINGTTPTQLGISSIIVCRLFRQVANDSDTFDNPVGLLGFDIHYEKDTEGSRNEFTK